ncbi:MAG: response regulator [Asgard group archaeon]|nr:response regulator [Asgard group archaeon]
MTSSAKIIVIDDNEIIRNLLHDLLMRKGYETFVASNGESALKTIKQMRPQLAIVDLVLPDISGIDILKEIRDLSSTTESIVITGHSSYDYAKQVLETNAAAGFLEKPIDVNKLMELIKSLLSKKREEHEIQQTIEELERINQQLEFFNSIITRDFEIMNNSLGSVIDGFSKTKLSKNQRQGLSILKDLYKNNSRLLQSLSKFKVIHSINPRDFKKIDILTVLEKANRLLYSENPNCPKLELGEFKKEKYYVIGTMDALVNLFYELFFSMAIPSVPKSTKIQLDIRESQSLIDEENNTEIPTIEVEIQIKIPRVSKKKENKFSEVESQSLGLGFFLVKNLIDTFGGKVFIEDNKEEKAIQTTFIVYLPKATT